MTRKVPITCALTGVLTNPAQHPVPVTPAQMAQSAKEAFDAGASIMHIHFRQQDAGRGHLPSWEPDVAALIVDAIRDACKGVIINMSTGVVGSDLSGPVSCLKRVRPEIAACNAGTLNYLKTRSNGEWAWPPMIFDNSVAKVQAMLDAMREANAKPEFECFDVGIVRSVGMYADNGMVTQPDYNFVMGVASGMPADCELLELLLRYKRAGSSWQTTLIGREEIWSVHQRTIELGGRVRTGLEDTFYLPDGSRASGNGQLIEALAKLVRDCGFEPASPDETRNQYGLQVSPS